VEIISGVCRASPAGASARDKVMIRDGSIEPEGNKFGSVRHLL